MQVYIIYEGDCHHHHHDCVDKDNDDNKDEDHDKVPKTITTITMVCSAHMVGSNDGVSDFKSSLGTPTMTRSLSGSWQG